MITRRELLAGFVASATMRSARAQQKVYRLAIVDPSQPLINLSEQGNSPSFRAFFQRLRELGYVDGQNLTVERYSGEGRTEHFADLASEAVRDNPDIMYVVGDRLAKGVKAATSTIPVVTIVGDPIAQGIVVSLARPAGNITGITVDTGAEIDGKRLSLLREMVPTASKVGFLASRVLWEASYAAALREAAQSFNLTLIGPPLDAPFNEAEYRRVFGAMAQSGADAVIVFGQPENLKNGGLIVQLAEQARLPTMYSYPELAEIGGLIAYGVNLSDISRHAAEQIDQVLKGTKPSEIPFYQPTKFVLAVNRKTAKALGITVPPTLLIAADEVIE
jgi:putative ABC transport system substrate-binding protein